MVSDVTSACVQLQQRVQHLLGETVLSSVLSLSSVHEALEAIAQVVNALPPVDANDLPGLPRAVTVAIQLHPLIL